MKKSNVLPAFGLAVLLAACGGGGNDEAAAVSADADGTATVASHSDTDAYIGSWKSICINAPLATTDAPTVPLKQTITLITSRLSAKKMHLVAINDIYPWTGCTGQALARYTKTSADDMVVFDDSIKIGGATAYKVTATHSALGDAPAIPGVIYPSWYFTAAVTRKDLLMVTGNILHVGVHGPEDLGPYPGVIDPNFYFTKQ